MRKHAVGFSKRVVTGFLIISLGLLVGSCSIQEEKPTVSSAQYQQAVSDFYLSLAAMQADQALFAVQKMQEVADQYPQEPAAWANLAVYAVRLGNFDLATKRIQRAIELTPESADLQFLAGVLQSRQGNADRALNHLKKAFRLDSASLQIQYALADELERQNAQANRTEITRLYESMLSQESGNIALLLELVRISAKWGDEELLNHAITSLEELSKNWPESTRKNFTDLKQKATDEQSSALTFELAYLRNSLNSLPQFQQDLRQVQLPQNQIGFLISEFYWLPSPATHVKPADTELRFQTERLANDTGYQMIAPVSLVNGETGQWLGVKDGEALYGGRSVGAFPAGSEAKSLTPANIATIDFDYDFRNDLAFAGPGGFQLYKTRHDTTFVNVTDQLGLSSSVTGNPYSGVWARDIDSDGDLDIILSSDSDGVTMLRNNGDGTFDQSDLFNEVKSPVQFIWADFDGDGDSDAAFLTKEGTVSMFLNKRAGVFVADNRLQSHPGLINIQVADIDGSGQFDLISWNSKGIWKQYLSGGDWVSKQIIETEAAGEITLGNGYVHIADLDNNGAMDVITSGLDQSRYWLSDDSLEFSLSGQMLTARVSGFTDLNGDSRLDAVGLEAQYAVGLINNSKKGYHAKIIRPEASGPIGDQRINSFGIGGELEIRSGLLYQKHLIDKPWVHIGLGGYEEADMLRIIWPNGSTQAEFAELGYGSTIMNEQMLKGSCPWVFTYNGENMEFVTDFLWRTALGLRINAQGKASVIHSIDWIKIDGDQLKPKNGYYDVRITADLWETHFFDHVSLMAVDHPADTEVLVDERFTLPAPEQKLYPVSSLRPIEKALDHNRNDVTTLIRKIDNNYVDTFELTAYQGLAEEYYLEVHLGDNLPGDRPVYLVAQGWVYPTDSSINVAISQGDMPAPHGLFLQVPDSNGGWKTIKKDIGFPAGKTKTVLINLSTLPLDSVPTKIRLSTNMEIYWDKVSWAAGKPDTRLKTKKLQPEVAELRYRGFSRVTRESRRAPDLPDYQTVAATAPKWIDLVGHYTRFGDVKELVREIDDRYVIMNAGDELVFRFPALPAPPEGWVRDFVLIGDGWVKDGDYNTGYSKTVIPLPYHGMEDYSEAPGRLEDDPVYQEHRQDWVKYHTRYITPYNFRTALKFDN